MTIASSGGSCGSVAAGTNIVQLPSWGGGGVSGVFPLNGVYAGNLNTLGGTVFEQISSGLLLCQPSKWKVTIYIVINPATITLVFIKCTRGTGTVLSSTAVTFGGLSSPSLSTGLQQSDAISFSITTGFDYYFALNTSTNLIGIVAPSTATAGYDGGTYVTASNALPIGSTLPSWTSGNTEVSNHIIFDFVSA